MIPGGGEWLIILIVAVVLLFGASKVPQLARSFGQAMGEFKKAKKESELNLKSFEDSVVGDEKEPAAGKTAKGEKNDEGVNIREVAAYMGIDTEGKSDKELKEEVQAKMKSSSE